ncbi:hypothetical protein LR48_Vigan07g053100 [Vigna angularis]|uniref:Uncharacterized protein n=2 Tax=Phaseolus angularis TaxID=3914 RepID=A0A0L9UW63_PHAAN|nr:hypothetical protein LR48_Vigan07g053100 [Vigna angularis]
MNLKIKTSLIIPAKVAMFLFISLEVTATYLKEDKIIGAANKVGDAKLVIIGRRGDSGTALQGSDHSLPSRGYFSPSFYSHDLSHSRHLGCDLPSPSFVGRGGGSGTALQDSGQSLCSRGYFSHSFPSRDLPCPHHLGRDLPRPHHLGRDLPSLGFLGRGGGRETALQNSGHNLLNRGYYSSSFPNRDLSCPTHLSHDLFSPNFPNRDFSDYNLPNVDFPRYDFSNHD